MFSYTVSTLPPLLILLSSTSLPLPIVSSSFSEFFQQSFIPYAYTYTLVFFFSNPSPLSFSLPLPSTLLFHLVIYPFRAVEHDTLFGKSLGKILHSLSLPSAGWTRRSPAQIQLESSH